MSVDEPKKPASLDSLSTKMDRAIDDIEKITGKMDVMLDWRGRLSGGITLVSLFAVSICGFVGWRMWDDNTRIVQIQSDEKATTGFSDWKAKTDTRLETLEEKEITRHK